MANVAVAGKKTRAKKGDGPITVKFLNDKNESSKRIPDNVHSIQVTDKKGHTGNFTISSLPPKVTFQLAADALKRKFISTVMSATKTNGSADVAKIIDDIFSNIKAGKLYIRGEGAKKPGRQIDVDAWVAIMLRMSQMKVELGKAKVPFTKKLLDDVRGKLETGDKKALIAQWRKDAVVRRAELEFLTKKAEKATSEYDVLSEF